MCAAFVNWLRSSRVPVIRRSLFIHYIVLCKQVLNRCHGLEL